MVANQGSNDVWVFDVSTLKKLTQIPVGEMPESISLSSDGTQGFVTNWFSNDVSVINLETMQESSRWKVDESPRSLGRFLAD